MPALLFDIDIGNGGTLSLVSFTSAGKSLLSLGLYVPDYPSTPQQ